MGRTGGYGRAGDVVGHIYKETINGRVGWKGGGWGMATEVRLQHP